MEIRDGGLADIKRAVTSSDSTRETWIEVVRLQMETCLEETLQCPFCQRNDLPILDARAGKHADIFCDDRGARVSLCVVCLHWRA
jgi:hypothetical protein